MDPVTARGCGPIPGNGIPVGEGTRCHSRERRRGGAETAREAWLAAGNEIARRWGVSGLSVNQRGVPAFAFEIMAAHSKRESGNSLFDAGRQWTARHTGIKKLVQTT